MSKVINQHGREIDFESAVSFMNDDIREELHAKLSPCTEQEFFDAYAEAHEAKFGEEWFLAEPNPVW